MQLYSHQSNQDTKQGKEKLREHRICSSNNTESALRHTPSTPCHNDKTSGSILFYPTANCSCWDVTVPTVCAQFASIRAGTVKCMMFYIQVTLCVLCKYSNEGSCLLESAALFPLTFFGVWELRRSWGNGALLQNWHSLECAPPSCHFVNTITVWSSAKQDIWQTGKWEWWTSAT